jgi:hypothetical protein
MLADQNWNHLAEARLASIPVYFGEVLSEAAHHSDRSEAVLEPHRHQRQ